MAAALKTLRKRRETIQRAITMLEKVLDDWETEVDDRDPDYLLVSLENTQSTFSKFHEVQDAIEDLDENESDQREILQTRYNLASSRARKYLREHNTKTCPNTSIQYAPSKTQYIPTKLPTITLPEFNGSIEGWSSFLDLFSSLIDKNEDLTPVQKLQYLRLSVKGTAARSIQELETTDENYEIALSILKKKYECNRRVLRRHWAILREYPKLIKDNSTALTQLIETFQQHIRALENLKAPVNQWDIPLIDLILTKISSTTAWHWELTLADKDMPSYKNLLSFLEKRANCGEFSTLDNTNSKGNSTMKDTMRLQKHYPISTQTFITNAKTNNNSRPQEGYKCFICKGPHSIYKCEKFHAMHPDERRRAATKSSLCLNCLSQSHNIQACKSSSCRRCGKRHHTYLHINESVKAEPEQSSSNQQSPGETTNLIRHN